MNNSSKPVSPQLSLQLVLKRHCSGSITADVSLRAEIGAPVALVSELLSPEGQSLISEKLISLPVTTPKTTSTECMSDQGYNKVVDLVFSIWGAATPEGMGAWGHKDKQVQELLNRLEETMRTEPTFTKTELLTLLRKNGHRTCTLYQMDKIERFISEL